MKIEKLAMAGSLESNDALITIKPSNQWGREIEIESIVEKQYGLAIKKIIEEVLDQFNIDQCYVFVQDRGALDCTLKARMETVILRSQGGK